MVKNLLYWTINPNSGYKFVRRPYRIAWDEQDSALAICYENPVFGSKAHDSAIKSVSLIKEQLFISLKINSNSPSMLGCGIATVLMCLVKAPTIAAIRSKACTLRWSLGSLKKKWLWDSIRDLLPKRIDSLPCTLLSGPKCQSDDILEYWNHHPFSRSFPFQPLFDRFQWRCDFHRFPCRLLRPEVSVTLRVSVHAGQLLTHRRQVTPLEEKRRSND